jgi:hypothetical protein
MALMKFCKQTSAGAHLAHPEEVAAVAASDPSRPPLRAIFPFPKSFLAVP